MARTTRSRKSRTTRTGRTVNRRSAMVFSRWNYIALGACVVAMLIGYALMRMENSVDGFISLYVSPIILILAYMGVIPAILYRPRQAPQTEPGQ